MIVCHCEVVNDRAVVEAFESGARTLAGVCQSDRGRAELWVLRLLAEAAAVRA